MRLLERRTVVHSFLIAFLQVAQRVPNTDVNLFSFMSCFLFPQPGFSYRASF